LKLDHSKEFQLDAITSTLSLFEGQIKPEESFVDYVDGVVPNMLTISKEEILKNLKSIQKQNSLPISEKLNGMDFSIEMETGTGKTYVYLRTIYELNEKYGFKKFIIIVPSVAIREGTKYNFENAKKDFSILYNNVPIEFKEFRSTKLSYVRQFCRNNKIDVMIITRDSFNKDSNIMNTVQRENGFYGKKPIELIQKTNPILILDEPQNLDTQISKMAIEKLCPSFTLRYSATHKDVYNFVYRLSPVDAYRKQLVKKIQVMAMRESEDPNSAYIELLEIKTGKKIQAKLKVIKKLKDSFSEAIITVSQKDDLVKKTQNPQYAGFKVKNIFKMTGRKLIQFTNGKEIEEGGKHGGSNEEIQREQIRETILSHLNKQKELKGKNIKVLSLFFIDKVANYRNNGPLMKIFDEEFTNLKRNFDDFKNFEAHQVRDSYFSESKTDKPLEGDSESFDRIMKNKSKLLSFEDSVSFIFSHSALREGWDNPNVFNICTLNQSVSKIKKRQEIGRGLRIPVNQDGEQIFDMQYPLTVIANESYSEYVKGLQSEYDKDYEYVGACPPIENKKDEVLIKINKNQLKNKQFLQLWDKISPKTKFFSEVNSDELIKECIKTINEVLDIDFGRRIIKDTINIDYDDKSSSIELTWTTVGGSDEPLETNYLIKNILFEISQKTTLTSKSIVKILLGINNLEQIFKSPQRFTSSIIEIIKNITNMHLIEHIDYFKINKNWSQSEFKDVPSVATTILNTTKSISDKIVYDSEFEKEIANILNEDERVKFYLKLPHWYKIETPVGTYNPDWAIVSEQVNPQGQLEQTCYFVVESKAKKRENLGENEQLKMKCGLKHYESLKVKYEIVKTIQKLEEIQRKGC
jgi:type III restriction enzyme